MLGKQILLIRLILASKYKYEILDMGVILLKKITMKHLHGLDFTA